MGRESLRDTAQTGAGCRVHHYQATTQSAFFGGAASTLSAVAMATVLQVHTFSTGCQPLTPCLLIARKPGQAVLHPPGREIQTLGTARPRLVYTHLITCQHYDWAGGMCTRIHRQGTYSWTLGTRHVQLQESMLLLFVDVVFISIEFN